MNTVILNAESGTDINLIVELARSVTSPATGVIAVVVNKIAKKA